MGDSKTICIIQIILKGSVISNSRWAFCTWVTGNKTLISLDQDHIVVDELVLCRAGNHLKPQPVKRGAEWIIVVEAFYQFVGLSKGSLTSMKVHLKIDVLVDSLS